MAKEGLTLNEAGTLLNKRSGLRHLRRQRDMREIIAEMNNNDRKAGYAFDVFTYRVKKYIGAYAAAMGGLDAVVFTGGIGENSAEVRKACCDNLAFLGIELDDEKNASKGKVASLPRETCRAASSSSFRMKVSGMARA
jgi:acetate kinase